MFAFQLLNPSNHLFFYSRKTKYKYGAGTTAVLTEKVVPVKLEVVEETVQRMDTA